jgi:hypothetical protein
MRTIGQRVPPKMEIDLWIGINNKTGKPEHSSPIFFTSRSCQEWIDKTEWTKKKFFVAKGKLTINEKDFPAYM